jgi:hypothetical protein
VELKRPPSAAKLRGISPRNWGLRLSRSISPPVKMICSSSLNLQVAITLPNSRLQPVRSETYAPKPLEPGPNPNSESSYQSCHDWCRRDRFSRSKGLARESGPTNSRADLAF